MREPFFRSRETRPRRQHVEAREDRIGGSAWGGNGGNGDGGDGGNGGNERNGGDGGNERNGGNERKARCRQRRGLNDPATGRPHPLRGRGARALRARNCERHAAGHHGQRPVDHGQRSDDHGQCPKTAA